MHNLCLLLLVIPLSEDGGSTPLTMTSMMRRVRVLLAEHRLVRGVTWLFGGTVVARGLGLCAAILVARHLGLTDFGKFGILQSTLAMFQTFAGFGLGETATKYIAELRETDRQRAGRIAGLSMGMATIAGCVFALLMVVAAPIVAERTLAAPELAGMLRLSAPILLFASLIGAQSGALSGLEAFKTSARISILSGMCTLPLLVIGTYLAGLTGAVCGLVLSYAVQWILNGALLRRELRRHGIAPTLAGCSRELPVLLGFSLPALLGGVMVVPVYWFCTTLLVRQPGGYAEMGLFNAANQWYLVLLFIPSVVSQVALPIFSNHLGTGARAEAWGLLRSTVKANLAIGALIAVVLSLCSPFIMAAYGDGFRAGWLALVLVVVTGVFQAAAAPVGQFIAASGKMWIGFTMNLGWALAFVTLSLNLVDHGAAGLAGARLLAYAVHLIWTFWYAYTLQQHSSTIDTEPADEIPTPHLLRVQ